MIPPLSLSNVYRYKRRDTEKRVNKIYKCPPYVIVQWGNNKLCVKGRRVCSQGRVKKIRISGFQRRNNMLFGKGYGVCCQLQFQGRGTESDVKVRLQTIRILGFQE